MQTATPRAARRGPQPTSPRRRLAERLWLAAVATLVLLAGLSSIDGTYAMWREEAAVTGPAIDSGNAQLTARWQADHEQNCWYDLLPGESVRQQVTVTNTGDVPMALAALAPTGTPGLEIRAVGGGTEQKLTTPALHAEGQPLPALGAPGTALTLQPGGAAEVTVELTATDDLTPGTEVTFEVVIDGKQIR